MSNMFNPMEHRARVASLTRSREEGDPDLVAARAALEVANVGKRVRELVTTHALTEEQREALVSLVRWKEGDDDMDATERQLRGLASDSGTV